MLESRFCNDRCVLPSSSVSIRSVNLAESKEEEKALTRLSASLSLKTLEIVSGA